MIGECEMTGRRNVELFRVKIEGTMMNVCKECVKYGQQVEKPVGFKTSQRAFYNRGDEMQNQFIVKDYASRIKQARESKNLKQSELASKLNEKESLIHKLESKHLKPNFPLAKKLAKFLGITLIENIQTKPLQTPTTSEPSAPLTMEAAFLAAMKKKK